MTQPETPRAESVPVLLDRLAETILATPGVIRLEPTLNNALRRLGDGVVPAAVLDIATGDQIGDRTVRRAAADGISVRQLAGTVDVRIDLIVNLDRPARSTAEEVEQRVRTTLIDTGLHPGSIDVMILATRRFPETDG